MSLPTSVEPELLYHHLLSHCKEFGTTHLELRLASQVAPTPLAEDIGLLISLDAETPPPGTPPEATPPVEESKVCLVLCVQ